jgi:hypothetical protein
MNTLNPKTKSTNLLICLVCIITLLATGCKKDDKTTVKPSTVTGPYLYVGGGMQNKAIVWKTSLSQATVTVVPDTLKNLSYVSTIKTSGSDVYMAANGQASGYYKNNAFVSVAGASSISNLALAGTDVYTTGFDNMGNIAYWKNNTETSLENTIGKDQFPYNGDSSVGISGIAVPGNGSALITGNVFIENQPFSPDTARDGNFGSLWTNGSLHLFGQGYIISAVDNLTTVGVAVAGNDVYVAGRFPDKNLAGGYWKNGTFTGINGGNFISSSVTTSGADVYITGYTFSHTASFPQQGVYWKNGTLTYLPNAAITTAVAVSGQDVYVLGVDNNHNNVVWKNGNVFETLGSNNTQVAACIAIGS